MPSKNLEHKTAIVIGAFKWCYKIDDRYIINILKLSPKDRKIYTADDTPANNLLTYLREVIKQLGDNWGLPIIIEFFKQVH